MERRFYHTGKTGEILGLSPRKVSMLFDEGILKGVKMPFTERTEGKRRVSEDSILDLLARSGYEFKFQTFEHKSSKDMDVVMPEGFLSVGKVAEIIHVANRTVINYLNRGVFNGYVLKSNNPDYNLHKICKRSLAEYLQTSGMLQFINPELLKKYNLPLEAKAAA
ncbi:hypothetical protein J4429_02045 [Candidatus Pacearchaeota archaeon]|nr:hypothetical protein [Candidatus Pacearchaeota archaeon]